MRLTALTTALLSCTAGSAADVLGIVRFEAASAATRLPSAVSRIKMKALSQRLRWLMGMLEQKEASPALSPRLQKRRVHCSCRQIGTVGTVPSRVFFDERSPSSASVSYVVSIDMGTINLYYNVQQATQGMVSCCNEREHVKGIVLNIKKQLRCLKQRHTSAPPRSKPSDTSSLSSVSASLSEPCVWALDFAFLTNALAPDGC